jgi:hypothetical protein
LYPEAHHPGIDAAIQQLNQAELYHELELNAQHTEALALAKLQGLHTVIKPGQGN